MNISISLLGELPVLQRLALSYAPKSTREAWLALLALDARLAAILRAASEPMLAQLRLTWWREQLRVDPASWPKGEPLLAALQSWRTRTDALAGLVDGWEAMTGEVPLADSALQSLADARANALGALAEIVGKGGDREAALRLGGNWALADLTTRLSHPAERDAARALVRGRDWSPARLSREMRPLVVLHGLAARAIDGGENADTAPWTLLAAMRLGLLGR